MRPRNNCSQVGNADAGDQLESFQKDTEAVISEIGALRERPEQYLGYIESRIAAEVTGLARL